MRRPTPRTVAHWAAVTLGVTLGLVLFGVGLPGFFSIGVNDTWWTITTGITGTFTLLPLTVLGIARPRAAAHGITASFLVFFISLLPWALRGPQDADMNISNFVGFFFREVVPFCSIVGAQMLAVAGLFYYASSGRRPRSGPLNPDGSTVDRGEAPPSLRGSEEPRTGSVLFR